MSNDTDQLILELTKLLFNKDVYNYDHSTDSLHGKFADYRLALQLLLNYCNQHHLQLPAHFNTDGLFNKTGTAKNNVRTPENIYEDYKDEFGAIHKKIKQCNEQERTALIAQRKDIAYKIVHSRFFDSDNYLQQLKAKYFHFLQTGFDIPYGLFFLSFVDDVNLPDRYRRDLTNGISTNGRAMGQTVVQRLKVNDKKIIK